MGLGPNKEISKNEFIEAMRVRLEADEPGLGANVDKPDVQKNLGALGLAVFRIATVHAETISDSSTEEDFWDWVSEVNAWLLKLETWQEEVVEAFTNWSPTSTEDQNLRTAIIGAESPGSPPAQAPTVLKGKIK
jgi:hypothetical protein